MENKQFEILLNEIKKLGAFAFKFELESEYLSENFCNKILNHTLNQEFKTILKLGGFSSFNDIIISKNINADYIVAPMVETPYALEKFFETVFLIYKKEEVFNKKFFINIETKNAMENLKEIFSSPYIQYASGVVLGRKDLTLSLGFSLNYINGKEMFEKIIPVAEFCNSMDKKFIIGGEISPNSVDFLKMFPKGLLYGFETRKLFFKAGTIYDDNLKNIINKALELEIFYLEKFFQPSFLETAYYNKRIEVLKKRLNFTSFI